MALKHQLIWLLSIGVSLVHILPAFTQPLLVDEGVQVQGLWCFPVYEKPNVYRYLPSRARLAMNPDSTPQFSFMRYILEKPSGAEEIQTINQADGGGILHFLILYDTPEKQISAAQQSLRQRLDNDEIRVEGPVVFQSGRYALISSILNPQGESESTLLTSGEAPVLENSKIALTFDVDPQQSKLLMESLKMMTSDVSLVFELVFSGLTFSYEADLEVDWTEVSSSKSFSAGGSIYFVSADVEAGFDELRRNSAIKLTTVGSDDNLESLLNTVYSKLLELMFERVEPDQVPPEARGGLNQAIGAILGNSGMLNSRNTTGFGVSAGFRLKQLRTTGKSHLSFNGRSTVQRTHYVTFNAGDLYQQYGNDEQFFRDVPMWDPAFQQRVVHVGVDGSLEREFDRMVNSVTVRLTKAHENGQTTSKELLVNREIFLDSLGQLSMIYLNQGDSDRQNWMKYDYQTMWQFVGGGTMASQVHTDSIPMINLYTPFRRQPIDFEGDMDLLKEKGVRAVIVQIAYPFFGEQRKERVTIRPADDLTQKGLEITLPAEEENIAYAITWVMSDGRRIQHEGVDNFGLIFIDEFP